MSLIVEVATLRTENAELRAEVSRLKAACPHALDGACLDWQRLAARTKSRAEKAEAQADALAQTIRDVLLILGETRGDSGAPVSVNMLHRALASYDSGRQMPGEGR